ncbi:MAG: FtsK/SpoIIIE domain-containing protein, partial [Acidimicrobiia bacterium]|nr:FtsK/SpoIIIE domain-containing protein [Acidimicrobiia bacterium]
MRCRFTLAFGENGPSYDYRLDAAAGAVVADLVAELRVRHPEVAALRCGERALDASALLGDAVLDGSVLTVLDRHGPQPLGPQAPPHGEATAGDGEPPAGCEAPQLWVVGGPDAGGRAAVPPRGLTLGRGGAAELRVADPTLSPLHVRVSRAGAGPDGPLTVTDLGSRNGIVVDGARVDGSVTLRVGAVARVGATTLAVGTAPDAALREPDGDGGLTLHRSFRMAPPTATRRFERPQAPRPAETPGLPLLGALAPAVAGVALAAITGYWQFLLFSLLSPIMMLGNALASRRGVRRRAKLDRVDFEARCAAFEADVTAASAADAARRRDQAPDPARICRDAETGGRALWSRRPTDPDFLHLRAGLGDLPADVEIVGRSDGLAGTGGPGRAGGAVARDVPVRVDLAGAGVVGLAGPRDATTGLARWLVAQLSALHGPDDVRLAVLCGAPAVADAADCERQWGWVRHLPHARRADGGVDVATGPEAEERLVAALARLVLSRCEHRGSTRRDDPSTGGHAVVVVLDGSARLRALPAAATIVRDGPGVGVYCLCLDETPARLAQECRAVVLFEQDEPAVTAQVQVSGRHDVRIVADQLGLAATMRLARRLAPNRLAGGDAATGAGLPDSIRLAELTGLDPPSVDEVRARWRLADRSSELVLGVSKDGPLVVDLAAKGPHALVAGTTGAGKSELLKTLVASLAVRNRPDALNLVLVDYKGGSAFAECGRLPHTAGLVTDLDAHLVRRALVSLQAERRRRQHELARVGAASLDEYWQLIGADPSLLDGAEPLARLVLVIDEFAMLAQELPEFMSGLIDIARVGRTLGIHLVLATQRPSGVVSPEIRANVNLRIALRVANATESIDVLERADAASIVEAHRGRAYLRAGHELFVEFQSALVGGPRPALEPERRVHLVLDRWEDLASATPPPASGGASDPHDTDLRELVDVLRAAAEHEGVSIAHSPWLAPLPETLTIDGLPTPPRRASKLPPLVPFGLEDRPAEQSQVAATFDLAAGHLAVAGAARSGRTTLLRAIAAQVATTMTPDRCHIHALDGGGGGLAPLDGLPHTGVIVQRDEIDRAQRLVARLLAETASRQRALRAEGFAGLSEQWAAAGRAEHLPYVLLLVDRWESFVEPFREIDGGEAERAFYRLLAEGAAVGICVVIGGDKSVLASKLSSLTTHKLVLRQNDRDDYALADLSPRTVPPKLAVGRALRAASGTEIQIALLDPDPSGPAQLAAFKRMADRARRSVVPPANGRAEPCQVPFRLDVLPDEIGWADALALEGAAPPGIAATAVASGHGARDRPTSRRPVIVGVGGDRLAPIEVDLDRSGGFCVVGRPRSGRSGALLAMATSALRNGSDVVVVAPRPTPLRALPGVRAFGGDAAGLAELAELIGGAPQGGAPDDTMITAATTTTIATPATATTTTPAEAGATATRGFVVIVDDADALSADPGVLAQLAAGACPGTVIVAATTVDAA